jgi:exocyst complex component 4
MPGLVQGSSEQPIQMTRKSIGIDDRISGIGQRHRTVIKPDAFHVTVLFQPTLAFLARVAEVLPSGVDVARASGDTLEEFVLKVYLPQLEDKVSALFQQAVTGIIVNLCGVSLALTFSQGSEAFQPDPFSNRISSQPLLKVKR